MLTYTSLYIHLLDQFLWDLLDKNEVMEAAEKILATIATEYNSEAVVLTDVSVEAMMRSWSELFVDIVTNKLGRA